MRLRLNIAVSRQDAASDASSFVMRVMQRDAVALDVRRGAGFLARKRQPGADGRDLSDHSKNRCDQPKRSKSKVRQLRN